jgi:indolepyruvate decarboxylase
MTNGYTVSTYLLHRLKELGVNHLFGVPGDYVLDFLDQVMTSPVAWVGTCNELNAGYAADGYARLNGMGAAVVTYGVGGFSILNAVAGAFAEGVPMVLISGAPPSKRRESGAMVHHLVSDYYRQLEIFKKVTIDAVMLLDGDSAPEEIDRALENCAARHLPVYIELPADLARVPCRTPSGPLQIRIPVSDPKSLKRCVEEIAGRLDDAKNPAILAGIEVVRLGLGKDLLKLVERAEIPYATMLSSKCVLPEMHPQFIGIYQGGWSRPAVRTQVESSDCLLSLGCWMTDFDTGIFSSNLDQSRVISATSGTVRTGDIRHENIALGDLVRELAPRLRVRSYMEAHPVAPFHIPVSFAPVESAPLAATRVYEAISGFVNDAMILLAEPGDSFCAAPEFNLHEAENFVVQAYYSSIGFCTPAALGVFMARPGKRPVVLTGDGAFQMTVQEVSTMLRWNCPAVILLINNDGYLVERMLHEDGPYNDIRMWRYSGIPDIFCADGKGIGLCVRTEGELYRALETAELNPDKLVLIEICVGKLDCSEGLKRLGISFRKG